MDGTPVAGTAGVSFVGDYSQLTKGLAQALAPGKLSAIGKSGGKALAGGLAAAGVGAVALKLGDDFNKAFRTIRVGTGQTGKALKGLEDDFKAVARTGPDSFADTSGAIADLNTRLGLTGKPLQRLSRQVLDLSRVTETDLGENVASVTRLYGDWDVAIGKQTKTLDKLFRASQTSGSSVSELSRQMVQFGSPLRQVGFSLDEAAALFAKFEKEGVATSTMMPGLRIAIRNLLSPTEDLRKTFKQLGIDTEDPRQGLQDVMDVIKDAPKDVDTTGLAFQVFGGRAGVDFKAAIEEGRFELDDMLGTIRRGKDTVTDAADDTRTLGESWSELKNEIAVAVEPAVTRAFDGIRAGMDFLRENSELAKGALAALGTLAAGLLVRQLATLGAVIRRHPIFAISTLIAGSIVALRGFNDEQREVQGTAESVRDAIKGQIDAMRELEGFDEDAASARRQRQRASIAVRRAEERLQDVMNDPKASRLDIKEAELDVADAKARHAEASENLQDVIASEPERWRAARVEAARAREEVLEQIAQTQTRVNSLKDEVRELGVLGGASEETAAKVAELKREETKLERQHEKLAEVTRNENDVMLDSWGRATKGTGDATRQIREDLGGVAEKFEDGREPVRLWGKKIGDVSQGAIENMGSAAKATGEGVEIIGNNLNNALKALGVKQLRFSIDKRGLAQHLRQNFSQFLERQRGGMIPGVGDGDKVPRLVPPGTGYINKRAVRVMTEPGELELAPDEVKRMGGPRIIDAINSLIPRFQKGGVIAAGRMAQQMGLNVWQHPAFGGVTGGHAPGSYHYQGKAIDVFGAGGLMRSFFQRVERGWKGKGLAELFHDPIGYYIKHDRRIPGAIGGHGGHVHAAILGGAAGRAMEDLRRVVIQGPDGPLKNMAQSGVDRVWKAANRYLNENMPSFGAGEMGGAAMGSAQLRAILTRALKITGHFSPANLAALTRQAISESGGNPRAINNWDVNARRGTPSKGLLQTIDPTFNAYKLPRYGNIWNPLHNAIAAIRYMIARYGQIIGHGRGYQLGGVVEGLQRGGVAKRAHRRYNQFWKRVAPHLGAAGMPSPFVGFGQSAQGFTDDPAYAGRNYVWQNDEGMRKIFTTPKLMRDLGVKLRGRKRRRWWQRDRIRSAKSVLLHEIAHVFQRPEVWNNVLAREGGADLWKQSVGSRLIPNFKRYDWARGNEVDEFLRLWGSGSVAETQFGSNFGADPRTIRYPGHQRGGVVDLPTLDKGGRVVSPGIAEVHPGDVHVGAPGHVVKVFIGERDITEIIRVEVEDAVGEYEDWQGQKARMG